MLVTVVRNNHEYYWNEAIDAVYVNGKRILCGCNMEPEDILRALGIEVQTYMVDSDQRMIPKNFYPEQLKDIPVDKIEQIIHYGDIVCKLKEIND
jgi:sulfur carrier protein ThiS